MENILSWPKWRGSGQVGIPVRRSNCGPITLVHTAWSLVFVLHDFLKMTSLLINYIISNGVRKKKNPQSYCRIRECVWCLWNYGLLHPNNMMLRDLLIQQPLQNHMMVSHMIVYHPEESQGGHFAWSIATWPWYLWAFAVITSFLVWIFSLIFKDSIQISSPLK